MYLYTAWVPAEMILKAMEDKNTEFREQSLLTSCKLTRTWKTWIWTQKADNYVVENMNGTRIRARTWIASELVAEGTDSEASGRDWFRRKTQDTTDKTNTITRKDITNIEHRKYISLVHCIQLPADVTRTTSCVCTYTHKVRM